MTSDQAQALVQKHFHVDPTSVFPMPAYPGDEDPAWLVLTSGNLLYLVDNVAIEEYKPGGTIRLFPNRTKA